MRIFILFSYLNASFKLFFFEDWRHDSIVFWRLVLTEILMAVWCSYASKYVFIFLQGSCWILLFYLTFGKFTTTCVSAGFLCTNTIFSHQTWVFIWLYSLLFLPVHFPWIFHSETHNWWALKLLDLTFQCLSFSLICILLQCLPLLVVGRNVMQGIDLSS